MSDIQLGDAYSVEEDDTSDNLVISHDTNGDVLTYDPSADEITALKTVQSLSAGDLSVGNVGAVAYLTADQTIATATGTKVTLDAAEFDDENEVDTANHKITVADAAVYLVSAGQRYDNPGDGTRIDLRIKVNGADVRRAFMTTGDDTLSGNALATALNLSAGDEIELYTRQSSGADATLKGGQEDTYLSVVSLG